MRDGDGDGVGKGRRNRSRIKGGRSLCCRVGLRKKTPENQPRNSE